ncbi:MAG: UTP--glucose-phosphate uridylyltransferase [Candidatus Cloacimonadota bacterium]|jgi:UTP--glucose-1-phosphate uridylyltransferase|nr:UTP--glucose-phosphate uridylyltransferase [Candidatus Cloacimonadota bacterium]
MGNLQKFKEKMQQAGLNEIVIDSFAYYFQKVLAGETGKLSEEVISPPSDGNVVFHNNLGKGDKDDLQQLAVIKLNGGLGTSMGLKQAKSLIEVKNELNFLDIIARQILHLRKKTKKSIPLLFMNSFNTRQDTLDHLKKYSDLKVDDLPLDFLQNKFPKIRQKDLSPLQETDDKLNWNPPGHGEIYLVLQLSGILGKLLEKGYRYAFVSNSDNLGAVVDTSILSYMKKEKIPFIMEVCRRTAMDKKGGHLAETKDNGLILREVAQCPAAEIDKFQDILRYKYFNTNNIWIDLLALKRKLNQNEGRLNLTMILNSKTVKGEPVYQIETAMGAAIAEFENAKAVVIERDRFIPVKKTNELLALLSDAYQLQEDFKLKLSSALQTSPNIALDADYYTTLDQFYQHFIQIPSLKKCEELNVLGEVFFKENVNIGGRVKIEASQPAEIINKNLENTTLKL